MKDLFTIHQASKSCGISRATILRLEKKGLLTPAYIDKRTGYRYFDNHNISTILQIKRFLSIDMSYDDILLYYRSNGTSKELLKQLETKLFTIKRTYEEMKLRIDNKKRISFEFVTLPQYVCYTREYSGLNVEDRYQAMYDLYHEVIEKGYQPLPSEPLFIINKRTDFIQGKFEDKPVNFICCIPLEPAFAPKSAVIMPECNAFSCLCYGNYDHVTDVYNEFGKKLRELKIEPIDYPRTLCLVASYTGREIAADSYVSRLAIPIAENANTQ